MEWDKVGALSGVGCFILTAMMLALMLKPWPWKFAGDKAAQLMKIPRAALIFLALGFLVSGLTIWSTWGTDCSRIPSLKTDIVEGRNFRNEEVPLDGHKYVNRTFENVTFVFEGKATYAFDNSRFVGTLAPQLRTSNQIVSLTLQLLKMIQGAGSSGATLRLGG